MLRKINITNITLGSFLNFLCSIFSVFFLCVGIVAAVVIFFGKSNLIEHSGNLGQAKVEYIGMSKLAVVLLFPILGAIGGAFYGFILGLLAYIPFKIMMKVCNGMNLTIDFDE